MPTKSAFKHTHVRNRTGITPFGGADTIHCDTRAGEKNIEIILRKRKEEGLVYLKFLRKIK